MEKVTGVGGIFIKAKDKAKLLEWYRDFLGIPLEVWGGAVFHWSAEDQPSSRPPQTVWSIFADDSPYFGASGQRYLLNFRVRDLDAMLSQLRSMGADVSDKSEKSEYGNFGWVTDPEGNRIELWEPPDRA